MKFSVSSNFIAIGDFSVHECDLPLLGRQIIVIGGLNVAKTCYSIFVATEIQLQDLVSKLVINDENIENLWQY